MSDFMDIFWIGAGTAGIVGAWILVIMAGMGLWEDFQAMRTRMKRDRKDG